MLRARRIQRFLSQNTYVAKQFTGIEGSTVPVADTIEAFNKIADGDYDHVAEQAFFMCGGLDDVEAQVGRDPEEPLMSDKLLQVELVAADRLVWSGEAKMVIARTTEGDVGILRQPRADAVGDHRGRRRRADRRGRDVGRGRRRRLPVGGQQPRLDPRPSTPRCRHEIDLRRRARTSSGPRRRARTTTRRRRRSAGPRPASGPSRWPPDSTLNHHQ